LTDVNDQSDTAVASYSYDYLGRRISKTVYGSPDVTTKYCYDGGQVIAEYDGSDNLLRKFIYGPGIDEPICMIDVAGSNAVYYYHFDGLGSVAALSDVNNVVVESYSYDVFGAPTIYDANETEISKSTIGNPYMFTARRADDETALYYYRARYYAFDVGRFLQTDPVGYLEGMNLYTYCGNNPLNLIDPMGLCKDQPFSWWDNLKISIGSAIGDAIGWWYEQSGGQEMEEYYWEGRHVGTQYGEQAADWYAQKYLESETWYGQAGYYTLGLFASLWTPESWKTTTTTVAAAGVVAEPASETGPWLGKVAVHLGHSGGPHQFAHPTKSFYIPLF
jgi:RHS repeat-associated protein